MADELSREDTLSETVYKTQAWQYRHAVVTSILFFFSLFYMGGIGIWSALKGFVNGVKTEWYENVKPFLLTSQNRVETPESNVPTEENTN